MEEDFKMPVFPKVLLTSVFIGIMGSLLSIVFDIYFVKERNYPLSAFINVSTLIFSVNILFFIIGFIYYGFISASKKGEFVFIVIMILLTVFGVWKAEGAHRTDDQVVNSQFRSLLSGIIIILGLLAAVGLPILVHNKKFQETVI
jgi:hypothetical protein